MSDVSSRLHFALQMASAASELILKHYQVDGLLVESKSDDSPVTVADRGAEQLIRKMLAESFPQDGILGEEFESIPGTNGYRWIIDPIDGTKPFVHGVPLFGTLIGLNQTPAWWRACVVFRHWTKLCTPRKVRDAGGRFAARHHDGRRSAASHRSVTPG